MPLQYALTEYRSDKEKLLALFDALVSHQPSLTVDGVSLTAGYSGSSEPDRRTGSLKGKMD